MRLLFLVPILLSSAAAIAQDVDPCLSPTISVQNGLIVGGPDDGKRFRGTLRGTRGDDVIAGTPGNDRIRADRGDDVVCGYAGKDTIHGANGNDAIFGGDGDDKLYGQNGDDEIHGGKGNDKIVGANGSDYLYGDEDKDDIQGQAGDDFLYGGSGQDKLVGGPQNDELYGEDGDDNLWGHNHDDFLVGGNGLDKVVGQSGTDECKGEIFLSCETESDEDVVQEDEPIVELAIALPAEFESLFGADPSRIDSDGDGLVDTFEIAYGYPEIKPDSADTDGDGITDDLEDTDSDGLSNAEEQQLATDPLSADTDEDSLSDIDEVRVYLTDPLKDDTDGDGINDGREIELGTDPLVPDANTQIKSTAAIPLVDISTGETVEVSLSIEGQGDIAGGLDISLNPNFAAAGKVSKYYDIDLPTGVTNDQISLAQITLPYDPSDVDAADPSQLAVFTINPDTGFWEALPSVSNPTTSTITATTTHFSPFFVANQSAFQISLDAIPNTCAVITDPNAQPTDVVLVIDVSGSMSSNDPSNLRQDAARGFISAMKSTDQVAVVSFNSSARILSGLTNDMGRLNSAISGIGASGGTNIGSGVGTAISLLQSGRSDINQSIILLTDGQGSYNESLTAQMRASGIRAFTIALGSSADESLLRRIADGTQAGFKRIQNASSLVGIFAEFATVFGDDGTDTDGDGLTDCQEVQGIYIAELNEVVQTDPNNDDSDGDGISDGQEVGLPSEILSQPNTPFATTGISDPNSPDSDGDLIPDSDEYLYLTNPFSDDSDGDGISDYAEIVIHETSPYSRDTDGDGLSDGEELNRASEGFDPAIFDHKSSLTNRLKYYAGFAKGFIAGDFADIDNFPELSGQIISSFIPLVDLRDVTANLLKEDYIAAGLSGIGLVPVAGDGASTVANAARYIAKNPGEREAVVALMEKLPGGADLVKQLPGAIGNTGAWLKGPFVRGRELEVKLGDTLTGEGLQKMYGNFKQFDTWDESVGVATSIKTIDLNAKTYQTEAGFRAIMNRSLRSLDEPLNAKGLQGKDIDGDTVMIFSDQIQRRDLLIGVPREPSGFQQKVIDEFLDQGKNITIEIID